MKTKRYFTKADVARIARILWKCDPCGRADGRDTVRAVLEVAGFKVEPRKRKQPTPPTSPGMEGEL